MLSAVAKTSGCPMGYGSPALITEHAAHESMSPQAGIIRATEICIAVTQSIAPAWGKFVAACHKVPTRLTI